MNGASIGAAVGTIGGLIIGYILYRLYHKYKGKKWSDLKK